jgi:uncharacterized membrane protein YqjE
VRSAIERLLVLPDTLARAAAVSLDLARNRLELFSLEAREEGMRLILLAVWTAAAAVFAGLTLILLTFGAIYALPDGARSLGLLGFAVFYALCGAAAILVVRRRFREMRPFARSIEQLKKDRESF